MVYWLSPWWITIKPPFSYGFPMVFVSYPISLAPGWGLNDQAICRWPWAMMGILNFVPTDVWCFIVFANWLLENLSLRPLLVLEFSCCKGFKRFGKPSYSQIFKMILHIIWIPSFPFFPATFSLQQSFDTQLSRIPQWTYRCRKCGAGTSADWMVRGSITGQFHTGHCM